MKKTLCILALCAIIMTIIGLFKPVKATSPIGEDKFLKVPYEEAYYRKKQEEYQEWEEKDLKNLENLDIGMEIIKILIAFNVFLFSVLMCVYKDKKVGIIYTTIQLILLLLLEILYLYSSPHSSPPIGAEYIRKEGYVTKNQFAIMEVCVLIVIKILKKNSKKWLCFSSIISGAIFVLYQMVENCFFGIEINVLQILPFIAITNILFIPLYLNKPKLKEEKDVRI